MRTIFIWLCCIIATGAAAQTVVNKSYPVKPGQTVELEFDYPKVIRVSTWDKNEVSVTAKVSINDGENDALFYWKKKPWMVHSLSATGSGIWTNCPASIP
jgi:hypothetical protein